MVLLGVNKGAGLFRGACLLRAGSHVQFKLPQSRVFLSGLLFRCLSPPRARALNSVDLSCSIIIGVTATRTARLSTEL